MRGEHILDLLRALSVETLLRVRKDLGDETFANTDLVRAVDVAIETKSKQSIQGMDTISVDPPEFWDN